MASIEINHRGSYEHYKTRTKVFINWVTEAARKCCKLEDIISALGTRSGKNARKNGEEILLTTREITTLCQKVAEKKSVKIPEWILTLLQTIIDRRTATAAIFHASASGVPGSDLERSNVGHAHFIDILQQAYDMLAAVDESRIIRRRVPVRAVEENPLDNLFEHLQIKDTPDTQLEEEELEERAADPPRIRFKVEVDDKQETLEQLGCLLDDMRAVRLEIEATFKQYTTGEVTYDVACMVASIGFGIIRRACEHFVREHPEFGDYSHMLKFLGLRMERHGPLAVVFPECRDEQDTQTPPKNPWMADVMRHTVPSLIETSSLCVSGADIILQLEDDLQGSGKTFGLWQQRHGFAQLLHDAVPAIRKLKGYPKILQPDLTSWYGDEFLSGILNHAYGEQQGLPIWLAVITQCYRNIYDLLGGDMRCGAPDNTRRWVRYQDIMNSVEDFEYCTGDGGMRLSDPVRSSWFAWFRSQNLGSSGEMIYVISGQAEVKPEDFPSELMKDLPTVTSRMAFTPSLGTYLDVCKIANTGLVVQCAAHLYAACHYSGLVSRDLRWHDMDFFLKHHKMYADTNPGADPYSLINHFCLSMGIRRSTLAKARSKPELMNIDVKRACWIRPSSKLMWKLAEASKNTQIRGKPLLSVHTIDVMLEALADCSKSDKGSKSSKAKGKNFSPIELLSVLKTHLIADEPERDFDLIGFSQQCSNFIAEVRERTSKVASNISSNANPHDLTGSILAMSAEDLDEGAPASSTLLSVVARLFMETIAGCGDQFSKDAYSRSSGHLPPDLKPRLSPKTRYRLLGPLGIVQSWALETDHRPLEAEIDPLMRECLGKVQNWAFEGGASEGAIYHAEGTIENFQQVAKMYTFLLDWNTNCAMGGSSTTDVVKGFYTSQSLVSSLKTWVSTGSDYAAMPAGLVDVVAMGLEGTEENGSVERAREWLAKLFMRSN